MAARLKPDSVVYLYGITETLPTTIPELIGVDRFAKVEALECGGVVCWISRVSALDFDENLSRNLENLDWLAETSVAHQRVIQAVAGEAEILPTRLGTIFRRESSLAKHIRQRARSLKRDFARIKGAEEWGVKVFQIQPPISVPRVRSGKDYLKAKAARLPSRRKAERDGDLRRFERALLNLATEVAPGGNVSRGQRGVAFQTTLLVNRAKRGKLELLLEKFARLWEQERRIECTGPWPPYSFVSRPDDGAKSK
jgi:Gas vesicle synthesis protein GvpL/GvpF